MTDLRIGYQLADEVRARLGALAAEFERAVRAERERARAILTGPPGSPASRGGYSRGHGG